MLFKGEFYFYIRLEERKKQMKLNELKESFIKALQNTKTLNELNELKSEYLGKKSPIQKLFADLKDMPVEEKKTLGMEVNSFKAFIETECENYKEKLEMDLINQKLKEDIIDLTLPGSEDELGTLHPLRKTVREIEDLFIRLGYTVVEGSLIESDLYNFEKLNLPKDHPARDMQDSFYIDPNRLLRSQTSPVQIHEMENNLNKNLKIISPGKVFRRDNDDATHSHEFEQIEGLVIGQNVTMSDLKGTLLLLSETLFGQNLEIRLRPSYFPFTEPSVEVDVECFKCHKTGCGFCKESGFIEVLGAGMVHPNVLKMAGFDPDKFQGFAFGLGVERITMLKYGIDDIRHFYNADKRFLKQFRR